MRSMRISSPTTRARVTASWQALVSGVIAGGLVSTLVGVPALLTRLPATGGALVGAALAGGGWAAGVAYAALLTVVSFRSRRPRRVTARAFVVLGAGLVGRRPSRALAGRLRRAADLWRRSGEQGSICVTGGQGPDEECSEASAMSHYLVTQLGVPPAAIVLEDQATTTRENLGYSRQLLAAVPAVQVVIVTNSFHTVRTARLAAQLWPGVRVVGAPTTWWYLPYATARELAGLLAQDTLTRRLLGAWLGCGAVAAVAWVAGR